MIRAVCDLIDAKCGSLHKVLFCAGQGSPDPGPDLAIPEMAVGQVVAAGRLHLLHLLWMLARAIGLVRRRHRQPTAAETAFLELLQRTDLL